MSKDVSTMLPHAKCALQSLGRVLVLGLGVTGQAALDYCLGPARGRVSSVTVATGSEEAGFDLCIHSEDVARRHVDSLAQAGECFDLCIASPGIPEHAALYRQARELARELISEVEFAWRESAQDSRWVAVTGTNGKSTTTALAAHLLQAGGLRASAVGNIGDACITAVANGSTDVYVAEVSSYQLASTIRFAPDVAVLLAITPDHLAWHGSFQAYVDAKARVFAHMDGGHAVVDASCDVTRALLRSLRAEGRTACVPLGTAEGVHGDMRRVCGSASAAFVRTDGMLVVDLEGRETALAHVGELLIPGAHNQINALAAASAALCLGADAEKVGEGLRSFHALEHRIEACGTVGGVSCYNDSKATNVDATLKALCSFERGRVVVMLGGDDKGTDLSELVELAARECRAAVCFGAAGPRFFAALDETALDHVLAAGMEQAFDAALELARPGDVVLLSPACASFDEFDNFEQRGRVFKRLVKERQG